LLATGENDSYLTGAPKHTFFKKTTATHSFFGQSWSIIANNPKNLANQYLPNTNVSLRLPVEGDLINDLLIRVKIALPDNDAADALNADASTMADIEKYLKKYTALSIIKKIIMKNNDKIICEIDNQFICNYYKLHMDTPAFINFYKMTSVGNNKLSDNSVMGDNNLIDKKIIYLYIPVPFWFTKDPKQSFPVWALHNPNITFDIELGDYENITTGVPAFKFGKNTATSDNYIHDIELLINYTYLNNLEKKKFENLPLEYIIEQTDIVNTEILATGTTYRKKIMLPKSNFVKYIMWGLCPKIIGSKFDTVDTSKLIYNQFSNIKGITKSSLSLNGNRVLNEADSNFTSLISRYNFFKFPENDTGEINTSDSIDTNIHTYSYCLDPMNYKLSGFLNTKNYNTSELMLDIDLSALVDLTHVELRVYQIKHNIIRFKDGSMDILYN
tara:strand:+ start:3533 stop:4861 length:1329 start_codon:yes stop_codon:yes gene_type:complete